MSAARRLIALLALLVLAGVPAAARAGQTQESIFQDDDHLLYTSTRTVNHTLSTLHSLGVQRVRVTVKWSVIAPGARSRRRPAHFSAVDPAAYGAAWAPYDRIARLAPRHGISVEFDLTGPGPLWAMQRGAPDRKSADHWYPDPLEFFQFVFATGLRYSGHYSTSVPTVHAWSIWNEPNQPGWLAPQWRSVGGQLVPNSPRLYRQYVQYGLYALFYSGHTVNSDTILFGELAPEGYEARGAIVAMPPMTFLRALYCVDSQNHPLRGDAATALGCPTSGTATDFVVNNVGLFYSNGFAHHPYYFTHAPWYRGGDPNFLALGNLGRLERALDGFFRTYDVPVRIPIYLTEYGYQTDPPDPYSVISTSQQAAYLNAADYMAWRDPRVRSVAQFLLYDARPDRRYKPRDFSYWDTFQTGLLFANGRAKPAYAAYRLPIWLPSAHVRRGSRVFVWGQLRSAPRTGAPQQALIQWRGGSRGGYRTLARVTVANAGGFLTARVRPPAGSGVLRILWQPARGRAVVSRDAGVRVG
jgi:hypothetical protein